MKDKVVNVNVFDKDSIDEAINELERYEKWLNDKTELFVQRMADEGVEIASINFEDAAYAGTNDVKVHMKNIDSKNVAVVAVGAAVLFIEFGTGLNMGEHPERPAGYYPGSYGNGRGSSEKGWFYKGEIGNAPAGTGEAIIQDLADRGFIHTYGNPANMSMYMTVRELVDKTQKIASEVFVND